MPARKKAAEEPVEGEIRPAPKKRAYVRKAKAVGPQVIDAVALAEPLVEAPKKKRVARKKPAPKLVIADADVAEEPSVRATAVRLDEKPQVSVVIPAYNEAERIAPTLVEAHAYFASRSQPFEVLVVDDGSADRTPEIVERMSLDFPQLRLVRMDRNGGKGAAVARGMLEARGGVRLFADADGATPFAEYAKLEEAIREGADIAIASRAMKGSVLEPPQPLHRRMMGKVGNVVIQATNLPGIKDSQCGFKAFTAEAAESVFPRLTQHRWGFDIEALVIAKRLKLKIAEIPVFWRDQAGSKVGSGAHLQTLWEDLRIRYNAITGAYPKR